MENIMALLKTDNFLIIFAILLIVLLISYVVLIIKTSNLNKRYKQFMKKLGNGKNIEEVMALTIDQALEFFPYPKIRNQLQCLHDVGLGYMTL